MQTSPISQTKNYDSEFCGSIPLHLVNLIQPHGLLMILDKSSLRIVQVSENIEAILGIPTEELLNQPLATYIHSTQLEEITNKLDTWKVKDRIPVNLQFTTPRGQKDFTAIIHSKDSYIMIELEQVGEKELHNSFLELYQEIKYIMAALKEAKHMNEITEIAAEEIKKLSGFDRVMLYKFDKDWNGTVLAEAKEPDMEPYLHLRFPESDVPKQARDLYFKNPFRLIPDRNFVPARLIPVLNPITKAFTDLSDCTLRSVPPVHIEYLKNMNVVASMSTPVIIDNQLWGLISCHHKSPKYLNYEMRAAFELLSNVISVQIAAKENEKQLIHKSHLNNIHSKLLEKMYVAKDPVSGLLAKSPNVMDLLDVQGVAIAYEGELKITGKTPATDQIKDIIKWLQIQKIDKVFATDSMPKLFVGSAEYAATGSGLIAIPISSRRANYILGFRPEVIQTVEWGGNPNERIQFEPDGKTYHPRNSFATWQEIVKDSSIAWTEQEIEAAETLRTTLLERILSDKS